MSKKNITVVNGEQFWDKYFQDYNTKFVKLQDSKWVVKNQKLWVIDGSGVVTRVDGVMWRGGATKPHQSQKQLPQ